jgi:hypothetical protein
MEDEHIIVRRFHATVARQVITVPRFQTHSVGVQIGWRYTRSNFIPGCTYICSIPNAVRFIPYRKLGSTGKVSDLYLGDIKFKSR